MAEIEGIGQHVVALISFTLCDLTYQMATLFCMTFVGSVGLLVVKQEGRGLYDWCTYVTECIYRICGNFRW